MDSPTSPTLRTSIPAGRAPRVLIVDDEATIRIALRRFFSRMGWLVDEASNGEMALQLLLDATGDASNGGFALVLSDIRMPGINGMELYERLKVARPAMLRRLVFSTGDIVSEEASAFVSTTECVVLQKPFELSTLRSTIERVLQDAER